MTMMDDTPFSSPAVAFFDRDTGALLMIGPKTLPMPSEKATWSPLPTGYSDETHAWNAAARLMVEDPAKVEARLVTTIKADAERRKMAFLSPGGAKKAEYAQKAAEVAFWDSLGGSTSAALTAFGLLSPSVRQAKFGFALADAAAFGEPNIAAAIERFRSGMGSSTKVPAIAAAEARACSMIKAAKTPAAKRAAAAAVAWPT